MSGKIGFGFAVGIIGVVAAGLLLRAADPAAPTKAEKKCALTVDVVIDEVDLDAHTITATGTIHVVPPHDNVGGQIMFTGTTGSRKDQAPRYLRLPVMPAAKIAGKKPKAGLHAILTLEMIRPGCLTVVGIEEFNEAERIGVESLDAPGTKTGK